MKKRSCLKSVVLFFFAVLFFSYVGFVSVSMAGSNEHCADLLERFWHGYKAKPESYIPCQCYRNSQKVLQNLYVELSLARIPYSPKEGHVVFITDERNLNLMKMDPERYMHTAYEGNTPRLLLGRWWVWHVIAEFRGLVFDFDQPEHFSPHRKPMRVHDYFQQLLNQNGQMTNAQYLRIRSISIEDYIATMNGSSLKSGLRELFLERETPHWHNVESYLRMFP